MRVPEGCYPDRKLLLRGRVFKDLIKIKIPKETTEKQEELMRKMKRRAKMVREIRCCVICLL